MATLTFSRGSALHGRERPDPVLMPLPTTPVVDDVHVVIQAHYEARCASCSIPYVSGATIGHSREAGGWVGTCCLSDLQAPQHA